MFRVLSNQHYQHPTNQKLSSWANTVFQNHGVCGQAFPSLPRPSPSPVIPFFCCSRPNVLDELVQKRLLRRLVKLQFQVSVFTLITWLDQFFLFVTNSATVFPSLPLKCVLVWQQCIGFWNVFLFFPLFFENFLWWLCCCMTNGIQCVRSYDF